LSFNCQSPLQQDFQSRKKIEKVAGEAKHLLCLPMIFKTYFQYGMKKYLFRVILVLNGAFETTVMIVFMCRQVANLPKNNSFSHGCSANHID